MPSLAVPAAQVDPIVVGVDTHKDVHVAVALDALGVVLGQVTVRTTSHGLGELRAWARALGPVSAWGVEGTGCYGAGLARTLMAAGQRVVEINRPDRRTRRVLGGKTDRIDAEAAARAVLSDFATATPKIGTGVVEMIRMTRSTRRSAVKARTAAMNQLRALIVTGPPKLRDPLETLGPRTLITRCAALRPGQIDTTEAALRRMLRALARRWRALDAEVREHTTELRRLVAAAAPQLLAEHGVGPDTAAALLVAAGDNPHRLRSEAAFAALCGTNPIPASSGKTDRHRLNRNGDRQANAALHRIIVVRLANHPETQQYMRARRSPNRADTLHHMRCLKRALARRLYPLILQTTTNIANAHPAA
jgi:transposase